ACRVHRDQGEDGLAVQELQNSLLGEAAIERQTRVSVSSQEAGIETDHALDDPQDNQACQHDPERSQAPATSSSRGSGTAFGNRGRSLSINRSADFVETLVPRLGTHAMSLLFLRGSRGAAHSTRSACGTELPGTNDNCKMVSDNCPHLLIRFVWWAIMIPCVI